MESPRDRHARQKGEERGFRRRGAEQPGREEAGARGSAPRAPVRPASGGLLLGDDHKLPRARGFKLPRAVLRGRERDVVLDRAAEFELECAPYRRDREEHEAHQRPARMMGTRTISSMFPSRGLRVKTSAKPMTSDGGSVYVAVMLKVPREGAPAVAVVMPPARTRPAVSVTCQMRFASKTLASPLIVSGLFTRECASGSRTTISPRAEISGVGAGVGVAVGLAVAVGGAVAVDVRTGEAVGVVTTIR